jgi:hypothetical protein
MQNVTNRVSCLNDRLKIFIIIEFKYLLLCYLSLLMYIIHFHQWISNFLRLKTCGEKYKKKIIICHWSGIHSLNGIRSVRGPRKMKMWGACFRPLTLHYCWTAHIFHFFLFCFLFFSPSVSLSLIFTLSIICHFPGIQYKFYTYFTSFEASFFVILAQMFHAGQETQYMYNTNVNNKYWSRMSYIKHF